MGQNLYEVLGVSEDATSEKIKSAWRKLAKKHHPDRHGDADEFRRAEKAWAILSDPDRRERYDKFGETDPREALERLGDFVSHICNPKHRDFLLDPLRELKKMGRDIELNVKEAKCRIEIIRRDRDVLEASGRNDEIDDVLAALRSLDEALKEAVTRGILTKEKCNDLIQQYEIAKEIVGREERQVFMGIDISKGGDQSRISVVRIEPG